MQKESIKELMIRICKENNTWEKTIEGCSFEGNKPNVELYCQDGYFTAGLDAGTSCVFVFINKDTNELDWCNASASGNTPEEALCKLDELCKYIRNNYDAIVLDSKEFFR